MTVANRSRVPALFPAASAYAALHASGGKPLWADAGEALAVIRSWPQYAQTPLRSLEKLAAEVGVRAIYYKDESARFGLNSFKPLGAAFAISCELGRVFGISKPRFDDLRARVAAAGAPFRAVCATDGNHGLAVAWAAARLGLQSTILLHPRVSRSREALIRAAGAEVERVNGNYDDAVREAARRGSQPGWKVISDTAYPGYQEIPAEIMQGYGVLALEIAEQLPQDAPPTHLFVQAGVGGLAAGLIAAPLFSTATKVIVEPERAACLLRSAERGCRAIVEGELDTIMAGLACGEPSTLAWQRICEHDVHFIAIPDEAARAAIDLLGRSGALHPHASVGESGVAGLAGLLSALGSPDLCNRLELGCAASVVVIGSESAVPAAVEPLGE